MLRDIGMFFGQLPGLPENCRLFC